MKYEYPGEKHRCDCCGEEHEGNFCPLCGQKATHGPVTWKSVRAGILEIWGMHSRSLPYTAWQLLTRPGHLMRDYITGKRQVSFPPVKMLVILGVLVYLLGHWFFPAEYTREIGTVSSTGVLYYFEYYYKWITSHEEWSVMIILSSLILPTWVVFRHAPLIKRHSLPQGFFVQVFISNQLLVIEFVFILLSLALSFVPRISFEHLEALLFFVFLFVDYKQLFGYRWWGTIWRMIVIMLMILFTILTIGGLLSLFGNLNANVMTLVGTAFAVLFISLLLSLIIYVVSVINRKLWHERSKWQLFKVPVIIFAVMVLLIIVLLFIVK